MDKPLINQTIKDRVVVAIIKDGHKVGSKTFTFPNPKDKQPDSKRMGYLVGYINACEDHGLRTVVEGID